MRLLNAAKGADQEFQIPYFPPTILSGVQRDIQRMISHLLEEKVTCGTVDIKFEEPKQGIQKVVNRWLRDYLQSSGSEMIVNAQIRTVSYMMGRLT